MRILFSPSLRQGLVMELKLSQMPLDVGHPLPSSARLTWMYTMSSSKVLFPPPLWGCVLYLFYFDMMSCIPVCPLTHCVAKDSLEFMILGSQSPQYKNYSHELPCLVYVVQEIKQRASCNEASTLPTELYSNPQNSFLKGIRGPEAVSRSLGKGHVCASLKETTKQLESKWTAVMSAWLLERRLEKKKNPVGRQNHQDAKTVVLKQSPWPLDTFWVSLLSPVL